MKRRLLITGFEFFGGESINPSWEAVRNLSDCIGDFKLCKLQIPTLFAEAARLVLAKAEEFHPDVILCVGLAGGRHAVTPERIAVNIRDARIPDNAGFRPQGDPVVPGGPAAYFSTLPVKQMVQAIRDASLPAAVSNTAGTYVCNDVFYTLLHHYAHTHVQVGFIHVPYLPQQSSVSLPLDAIVTALTSAINAC